MARADTISPAAISTLCSAKVYPIMARSSDSPTKPQTRSRALGKQLFMRPDAHTAQRFTPVVGRAARGKQRANTIIFIGRLGRRGSATARRGYSSPRLQLGSLACVEEFLNSLSDLLFTSQLPCGVQPSWAGGAFSRETRGECLSGRPSRKERAPHSRAQKIYVTWPGWR